MRKRKRRKRKRRKRKRLESRRERRRMRRRKNIEDDDGKKGVRERRKALHKRYTKQQQQTDNFTMHQQIEPQPSRVPARRRTHLRKSCHGILRAGAPSCRSSLAVLPPGPHHLLHVSYAGVLVVGREGGG